jgi:hypothetical protein
VRRHLERMPSRSFPATSFDRSARARPSAADASARPDDARKRAARGRLILLTRLLDSAVHVPVLRTRVGLDALLGLVPVVGDLVSGALGLYLVFEARQLGASRWLQARMIGNLLMDAAVGAVPVAGDLFDIYFKAHVRNLKLLQAALGEPYIDGSGGRARSEDANADVIDVEVIDAPRPPRR